MLCALLDHRRDDRVGRGPTNCGSLTALNRRSLPRVAGAPQGRRAALGTTEWRMRTCRDECRGDETCSSVHFVSVTALAVRRAIAAHSTTDSIMLAGSAAPVPAMSSAVPWSGEQRGNGSPNVTFTADPNAATLMAV